MQTKNDEPLSSDQVLTMITSERSMVEVHVLSDHGKHGTAGSNAHSRSRRSTHIIEGWRVDFRVIHMKPSRELHMTMRTEQQADEILIATTIDNNMQTAYN